jgi:DNA-binding winged helix-turn-helix (wHTH) protein
VRVHFGSYTFDSAKCLLAREGRSLHLTRKAFLLLEELIRSRPAVVARAQILDRLWPDTYVEDGSVASLISEIRGALGREGRSAIRTVHGVGYSFVAEAREEASPAPKRSATAAAGGAPGPRFVRIEKGMPPRCIDLGAGTTVLGRGLECQVRVPSGTVSRTHARIRVTAAGPVLEDLGSTNGTYVGGRRVQRPVPLTDGADIRLGKVELIFRVESSPEDETEPVA